MNFKNIHIGQLIKAKVAENRIEMSRICKFIKLNEKDILEMYESGSLDTELLLKWSKLLEYDFFRLYTQHLILYSPPMGTDDQAMAKKSSLPQFRKNIYTKEVIDFILEQVTTGGMTKNQITERYRIPKTTLYKWITKYGNSRN